MSVARTVNERARALRRDEFLDVAQRLLQTKGYEQMSVQDVLAETSASKGAFYHYFGSKQALLEAVIARLADTIAAALTPVAELRDVAALDKVSRFFATLTATKVARRELLVELTRVWRSDDNAVVRQKSRPAIAARIAPPLAVIVGQGCDEGVFDVRDPEYTARVVVGLVQDLNEQLGELFLAIESGQEEWRTVEQTVEANTDALARILGIERGAIDVVDLTVVRDWFGRGAKS